MSTTVSNRHLVLQGTECLRSGSLHFCRQIPNGQGDCSRLRLPVGPAMGEHSARPPGCRAPLEDQLRPLLWPCPSPASPFACPRCPRFLPGGVPDSSPTSTSCRLIPFSGSVPQSTTPHPQGLHPQCDVLLLHRGSCIHRPSVPRAWRPDFPGAAREAP